MSAWNRLVVLAPSGVYALPMPMTNPADARPPSPGGDDHRCGRAAVPAPQGANLGPEFSPHSWNRLGDSTHQPHKQ
jgi:hypothetical protein